MIHKKAIMDDWLQIIFAIFFISFSFILFVGIRKGVEEKLENQAEQTLEEIEATRVLLEFVSTSSDGQEIIDIFAKGIAARDYSAIEKAVNSYFNARYRGDTTWSLKLSGYESYGIYGPSYAFAARKQSSSSVTLSLPNGELLTLTLSVGKDIVEANVPELPLMLP
ncbi:hypothetical protein HYV81_03775 [Candidatus Woesearchaeota archaeon]|nr:hypothetical protein [Candidatus Woesearchaeota archaeon]